MSGRALEGRRILITRRPEQAQALRQRLSDLGAVVLESALIEIAPPEDAGPLDAALRRLDAFDWALFTSANAVRAVAERLESLGTAPLQAFARCRLGSVGAATSAAVRERWPGVSVGLEPERDFRAEGLLAALDAAGPVAGRAFLLPVSDRARDTLPRGLQERGARVEVVVAYRTLLAPEARAGLAAQLSQGVDLVTFASPSAVEGFLAAAGDRAPGQPAAVIGPVTEQAARSAGLDVRAVAQPSTADGLVEAILRLFR